MLLALLLAQCSDAYASSMRPLPITTNPVLITAESNLRIEGLRITNDDNVITLESGEWRLPVAPVALLVPHEEARASHVTSASCPLPGSCSQAPSSDAPELPHSAQALRWGLRQ